MNHPNRVEPYKKDRTNERRYTLGDGCWLCRPGDRRQRLRAKADDEEMADAS